jgi:hypothetical protein
MFLIYGGIFISALIILLYYANKKFYRRIRMTKHFPGPKGHFFIGIGLEFFNMKTTGG